MISAKDVVAGGIAGCIATVPMTLAMELLHRNLPAMERYPLPPREVTMEVACQAGVSWYLDEDDRQKASLVAHLGMGTAMGMLYGGLASRLPLRGPVAGSAVGLAVWAGNYLGLLPAMGLLSPATHHPARRTAVMITAHLVWGAAAGLVLQSLDQSSDNSSGAAKEREDSSSTFERISDADNGRVPDVRAVGAA